MTYEIGDREEFDGEEMEVVSLGYVDDDGHLHVEEGKSVLDEKERCMVLMPDSEPGRAVVFQSCADVARRARVDDIGRDIDERLKKLRGELLALDAGEVTLEVVGTYMRAAYGKGYVDALTDENPHDWLRSHGFPAPGDKVPNVQPGD